jgi:hypothetical protein
MQGKYIIFERDGLEYPVLIPFNKASHNQVLVYRDGVEDKAVSAGLFSEYDGVVSVADSSITLNFFPRKEDANIIQRAFEA